MRLQAVIVALSTLIFSVVYYRIRSLWFINLIDVLKCPDCFGDDFCDEFIEQKFIMKKDSVKSLLSNYFSEKNVFYVNYEDKDVVFKKLAHDDEINKVDELMLSAGCLSLDSNRKGVHNYFLKIVEHLSITDDSQVQNFKLCTNETVKQFLNMFSWESLHFYPLRMIWYTVQLNMEPILLQLLRYENGWNVPHYYGACGRVIIVSDDGSSLNDFAYAEWATRANLTLQLLLAVEMFTDGHPLFRFYLTDISPDNIAVNSKQEVSFIDLENVIITSKNYTVGEIHYSSDFGEPDKFTFSQNEICSSNLSDHNYFSVCKLLLSKNAPWPMMQGGLLHTPPDIILTSHQRLFELIEICVNPNEEMNRFQAADHIINYLQEMMSIN